MIYRIDNVPAKDRQYFKNNVKQISNKFIFTTLNNNTVKIEYNEPFNITEKDIQEKSIAKNKFNEFLTTFRQYQFNQ